MELYKLSDLDTSKLSDIVGFISKNEWIHDDVSDEWYTSNYDEYNYWEKTLYSFDVIDDYIDTLEYDDMVQFQLEISDLDFDDKQLLAEKIKASEVN